MKKYLEYNDDKSSKFWEITVTGNSHTVRYGKIGTDGQSNTKEFSSDEEALKDAEKLAASKIKKGYVEATASSSPAENNPNDYAKILNAKNQGELHNALIEHFAYLADTPGFEPVLKAVMMEAHNAELDGDNLVINFRGDRTLTASPPADLKKYNEWPDSFRKCIAKHEYMSFPEEGWALYLGNAGGFEPEYLEDEESELLDYIDAEDALCPITDYSDWWLYHPGKKNSFGEPSLCFFSHEGGDVEDPQPYKVGAFFLMKVADILELEIEIPEVADGTVSLEDLKIWWENLSNDWKKAIKNANSIKEGQSLTDKELKKIVKSTSFYSHDEKLSLKTLEPLCIFKKLKNINLSRQKDISDLSPLSGLIDIESISIRNANVSNIDFLEKLTNLKRLELTGMPIMDIKALANLLKLERLDLSYTKVIDLTPIINLPKLEKINFSNTGIENLEPLVNLKKLKDINCCNTPVSNIQVLNKFKKLGILNFSSTNISDLSPLNNIKGIYILHCEKSKVSFNELMKFVSHRIDEYTSGMLGIDIYSEYLMDNEVFIRAVEDIDFSLEGLGEVVSIWVNDKMLSALKNNKNDIAERMLRAYLKHLPMKRSNFIQQELFGNTIVLLTRVDDAELTGIAMEKLMPEKITDSRVAFNLACLYSLRKDKENLLKYMKLALQLGHEPNRFKQEADFKDYHNDPDFLALCTAPQSPDPNEDPMGWWNSLNENWKNYLEWEIGKPKSGEDVKKAFLLDRFSCQEMKSLEPLRYLINLKELNITYGKFTSIDALQYLKKLERLLLEGDQYLCKIKIESVEPLKNLTALKYLRITDQNISDISSLKNLINIEYLSLIRNPISSIESLCNMSKLKDLGILFCDVDNLDAIKNCLELEDINLNKTKITNIEPLRNMKKLKKLYILNTQVSDLDPLRECVALESLICDNCPVTSLESLKNLANLTKISLGRTKVSEEQIKNFMENHPKCKIEYIIS